MIFALPPLDAPIDQGDILDGCPVVQVLRDEESDSPTFEMHEQRVIVLTQTCDLANEKTGWVTVAVVFEAQFLVDQRLLKAADIRGPLRAGRIYGWYYLPKNADLGLSEAVVDFRQLYTIRREFLNSLCVGGKRRARVLPLYREHLAKHFADTYSRIGLPEPYPTD